MSPVHLRPARPDRALPSASMLVAILALVVATAGGSAYAGIKIGTAQLKDNAVTSPKIKNGNVKAPDLGGSAVTSAKIADRTIQPRDLSAAAAAPTVTIYKYGAHNFGAVPTIKLKLPGTWTQAQVDNSQWKFQVLNTPFVFAWDYSVNQAGGGAIGFASVSYANGSAYAHFESFQGFAAEGLRVIQTVPSQSRTATLAP